MAPSLNVVLEKFCVTFDLSQVPNHREGYRKLEDGLCKTAVIAWRYPKPNQSGQKCIVVVC